VHVLVKQQLPDGQERQFKDPGENFTLGLAAQLFRCSVCGQSRFVEGGDTWDCDCGCHYEFEEDESEQLGYLHQDPS
jgi:hypothetical protein